MICELLPKHYSSFHGARDVKDALTLDKSVDIIVVDEHAINEHIINDDIDNPLQVLRDNGFGGKILIATSSVYVSDVIHQLKLHPDGLIFKPFNKSILTSLLADAYL